MPDTEAEADEPGTPWLMIAAPHKYGKGSNPVPGWPRDFAVKAGEAADQRPRQPPPDVLELRELVALGLRKPAGG